MFLLEGQVGHTPVVRVVRRCGCGAFCIALACCNGAVDEVLRNFFHRAARPWARAWIYGAGAGDLRGRGRRGEGAPVGAAAAANGAGGVCRRWLPGARPDSRLPALLQEPSRGWGQTTLSPHLKRHDRRRCCAAVVGSVICRLRAGEFGKAGGVERGGAAPLQPCRALSIADASSGSSLLTVRQMTSVSMSK